MKQYTVESALGKRITFNWDGIESPTESDFDEIFAEAEKFKPEPVKPEYKLPFTTGLPTESKIGVTPEEEITRPKEQTFDVFENPKVELPKRIVGKQRGREVPSKTTGAYGILETPQQPQVSKQEFTEEETGAIKPLSKEETEKFTTKKYYPGTALPISEGERVGESAIKSIIGGTAIRQGKKLQERIGPQQDEQTINRGKQLAESIGLTESKIKKMKGLGTQPTELNKYILEEWNEDDRNAMYAYGVSLLQKKKKGLGEKIEEYGKEQVSEAFEIDPVWLKVDRLRDDITKIEKSKPDIVNSWRKGNLSLGLDQMLFDVALSGDETAFKQISDVKEDYESVYSKLDDKDKQGWFEKTAHTIAEMSPGMVKGVAQMAIPGVGPLLSQSYWARQGGGDIIYQAVKRGVPLEQAIPAGIGGGLVYAAVEGSQVGKLATLNPFLKGILNRKIAQFIVSRPLEAIDESGEEFLQSFTTDASVLNAMKNAGVTFDQQEEYKKALKNGWQAFKESLGPMAAMGLPGTIRGGVALAKQREIEPKIEIKPQQQPTEEKPIVSIKRGTKTLADFQIPDAAAFWKLPKDKRDAVFGDLNEVETKTVMNNYPQEMIEEAKYAEGIGKEAGAAGKQEGVEGEKKAGVHLRDDEGTAGLGAEEVGEILQRGKLKLPPKEMIRGTKEEAEEAADRAKFLLRKKEAAEKPVSPYQIEQPSDKDRQLGQVLADKYGVNFSEAVEGDRDKGGVNLVFTDPITEQKISVTSANASDEITKAIDDSRKENRELYGKKIAENAGVEYVGITQKAVEADVRGRNVYKDVAQYQTTKGNKFTLPFTAGVEEIKETAKRFDEQIEEKQIVKPFELKAAPVITKPTKDSDRMLGMYIKTGKIETSPARMTHESLVDVLGQVTPEDVAEASGISVDEARTAIDDIKALKKSDVSEKVRNTLAPSLFYGETVEEAVKSIKQPRAAGGEVMFQREGMSPEYAKDYVASNGLEFIETVPERGGPSYTVRDKRTKTVFMVKSKSDVNKAIGDLTDRIAPQRTIEPGEGVRFQREGYTPEQKQQIERLKQEQIEGIKRAKSEKELSLDQLAHKRLNETIENWIQKGVYLNEKGELVYDVSPDPQRARESWTKWETDIAANIGAAEVTEDLIAKAREGQKPLEREEVKLIEGTPEDDARGKKIAEELGNITYNGIQSGVGDKPPLFTFTIQDKGKETTFYTPLNAAAGEVAKRRIEKLREMRFQREEYEPEAIRREAVEPVRPVAERKPEAQRVEARKPVSEDVSGIMVFTRAVERDLGKRLPENGITQVGTPQSEEHKLVEQIVSEIGGREVVFFDVTPEARAMGVSIGGALMPSRNEVFINVKTKKPVVVTAIHETMHIMQTEYPDLYYPVVRAMVEERTTDFEQFVIKMMDEKGYTEKEVLDESVAEVSGEMFTDPDFLRRLAEKEPEGFAKFVEILQRVIRQIRDFIRKSGVEHAGKYFVDLNRVERTLQDALTQMKKRRQETPRMAAQREAKFEREGNKQIYTTEFKRWFGDWENDPENASKVVDEDGKPIVVYHGTNNKEFNIFDLERAGENTYGNANDNAYSATANVGIWFNSGQIKEAKNFPYKEVRFIEAYISIKNPVRYSSIEELADEIRPYIDEENESQTLQDAVNNWKNETFYEDVDGIFVADEEFGGMSYVVFSPTQIKSATGNQGTFDPENPDIRFQYEREPADTFFSPTLKAVQGLKQERGTGDQMFAMITKTPGVKEAEWKWMGLDDFLKGKQSVTKAEIEEFVRENQVNVEEIQKGENSKVVLYDAPESWGEYPSMNKKEWEKEIRESQLFKDDYEKNKYEAEDHGDKYISFDDYVEQTLDELRPSRSTDNTKFSQYTLPGGTNYREVLLTLPSIVEKSGKEAQEVFKQKMIEKYGPDYLSKITSAEYADYADSYGRKARKVAGRDFTSTHWDEPNPIAHVRIDDRTGPEGEKVLFVEEIQSDWAKEARESGIADESRKKESEIAKNEYDNFVAEMIKKYDRRAWFGDATAEDRAKHGELSNRAAELEIQSKGVPPQPFLKNWEELILKRVLRMAAVEGYDRVAWINGEQTADRYDLSKQIDRIEYDGGIDDKGEPFDSYDLVAYDKSGNKVFDEENLTIAKVAETVGKDVAEKIKNREGKSTPKGYRTEWKTLSGLELKTGGEWAINLYDRMIPKFYEKYGKKWGTKVEPIELGKGDSENEASLLELSDGTYAIDYKGDRTEYDTEQEAMAALKEIRSGQMIQQSIPITPAMRESVLYEGQPMFQREAKEEKQSIIVDSKGMPTETTLQFLSRKIVDKHERLKALYKQLGKPIDEDEDAYLTQELMHGKVENNLNKFEEEHLKPIEKELSDTDISLDDLNEYLYAKHAPDRNKIIAERNERFRGEDEGKQTAGSGMTDEESTAIIDNFKKAGKLPQLEKIADMVYAINDARLKLMVENDLVSKEEADSWKETFGKYYVPLKGISPEMTSKQIKRLSDLSQKRAKGELTDVENEEYEYLQELNDLRPSQTARTGRGFDIRGKEVRTAYGRRSKAVAILENVINDMNSAIIRAEKNNVAQALLFYAEKHPDTKVFEIEPIEEKPYISSVTGEINYRKQPLRSYTDRTTGQVIEPMIVKVQGKSVSLLIKDPLLARSMQNLGSNTFNKVLQVMSNFSKYYSIINTQVSPEFIATNLARDLQTALANVVGITQKMNVKGAAKEVVKSVPKAIVGAWKGLHGEADTEWSKWFKEYEDAGGRIGWFGLDTIEDIQKRITRTIERAKPSAKNNGFKIWRNSVDLIRNLNGAVENATRLAVYVAMRKRDITPAKAASIAKNITVNFNKHGELGPIFNGLYAFSNASIQGTARLAQALKDSPRVRKLAIGVAAASFALAQLNRLVSGDDDDDEANYDKVPDYEKQMNMVIMLGKNNRIKIPLPYGYNIFWSIGQGIDKAIHNSNGAASIIGGALGNSFNFLGSSGSFIQTVFPTVTRWIADLGVNKDFTGKPILREEKYGPQKSQAYLAQRGTTELSKNIAKTIAFMSGGKEYEPGLVEQIPSVGKYIVSPDVYDYLVEFIGGGPARFGNNILRTTGKIAKGEEIESYHVPFVRRFYGTTTESYDRQKFYENMDKLEKIRAQYITYKKNDENEKAKKYREKHGKELGIATEIYNIQKLISNMNKAKADFEKKGNKNAAKKMDERIIEKMKMINSKIAK